MAYRTPARWLAPLALLGALAAIMVVVTSVDLGGSEDGGSSTPAAVTGSTTSKGSSSTTATTTTTASNGRRHYVVREGDTLSSIAGKTGVPLDQIEQLNPDVDAQTLRAGQRIKLRP